MRNNDSAAVVRLLEHARYEVLPTATIEDKILASLPTEPELTVTASSAPNVLPPPMSREDAVDPEEALVAAASACHMLFFLALAARKGFTIDRYTDASMGEMTKNERGKFYVSKITLRPVVAWSGANRPSPADIDALHHRAHEECYIANSIRAEVVIAPPTQTFV